MEESIRNEIPGTVKEIVSDKVLSEIILETAVGEIAAVITTCSVQEMGFKVDDRVAALVKATNVSCAAPKLIRSAKPTSACIGVTHGGELLAAPGRGKQRPSRAKRNRRKRRMVICTLLYTR